MSNTNIFIITLLFILLLLSAFFSAAETAYSTVRPAVIERDAKKGKKVAKKIKKHYKSFGWTLATILLSNNIVNVGLSSATTFLLSSEFTSGPSSALISTAIVTPLLVVFGEITPKLLAKKYSYSYLKKVVYVMEALNFVFFFITYPISKIALSSKVTNTEKDIDTLIDLAKREKVLDVHEATLAQKALILDSMKVSGVMNKKSTIVTIDKNATVYKAKKMFSESGHSRLVVRDKNQYSGLLLLKDIVFKSDKSKFVNEITPLTFVSQAKLVSRALEKMRINRSQLALVVKKKGSTHVTGIISIEDILEELVGEIYDEHDKEEKIREIAHFKYVVDGSTKMKELAKQIKTKFDDVNELTVKQWIQSRIQRRIKKNLRYEYKDLVAFKIISNKKGEETIIEIVIKE